MAAGLTTVLVGLSVAKIGLALVAIAWAVIRGPVVQIGAPLNSLWVSTLLVVSYGAIGLLLPRLSRADPRAQELGVFLLLVATAFSPVLMVSGHQFGELSRFALRCRVDAFLPAYLWMFVRDFPVRLPLGRTSSWPSTLVRISVLFGAVTFALNLFIDLRGAYWPPLLALMLPAAPMLLERASHVGPGDRRRVRLFVLALAVGLAPIAVDIVLRATSATWRSLSSQAPWSWTPTLVLAALLSVPATTAYSVVVDRVLDLKLMARAALQYALARFTIIAFIVTPLAWAAWSTFEARTQTIAEVVTARPLPLGTALFALVVVLPTRRRLFQSLDRQFFREQYDTDVILGGLVEASRSAGSAAQLAELLASEIDRALHPSRLAVLIRRDELARFETMGGASRSLPTTSMLAAILSASDEPIEIVPQHRKSILRRLDPGTTAWATDGDFRILVPLRGASGVLRGFVALGEKKSELPYSGRDQSMLTAIGATGGLCLDAHLNSGKPGDRAAADPSEPDAAAHECPACGLVYESVAVTCQCGATLVESSVPRLLAGKFRIERRIGAGGMGVVYQGTDLGLERIVAVKALRGPYPRDAWRLRREARAMALITHSNLALVYGLEFWFGRPVLVTEYLAGGTLADRLAIKRTLAEREVAYIGLMLANVLGELHESGMLHRDIKPANIGFTADDTIKLLDFGLARQFHLTDAPSPDASTGSTVAIQLLDAGRTPAGHVVGTPSYMSREALSSERPDQSFDLWSLAVTLFEAMAGVNPFRNLTVAERMEPQPAPDPRDFNVECSAGAAAFFAAALAPARAARPATADEFADLLDVHVRRRSHR